MNFTGTTLRVHLTANVVDNTAPITLSSITLGLIPRKWEMALTNKWCRSLG